MLWKGREMTVTDEMIRFEADMKASLALREELDAVMRRIADEGVVESDIELMAKAAAELGYAITTAELERSLAEQEELDSAELEKIAAGVGKDHDVDGHDLWCLTAWHCFTATLHTTPSDGGKEEPCWKSYTCFFVNKK